MLWHIQEEVQKTCVGKRDQRYGEVEDDKNDLRVFWEKEAVQVSQVQKGNHHAQVIPNEVKELKASVEYEGEQVKENNDRQPALNKDGTPLFRIISFDLRRHALVGANAGRLMEPIGRSMLQAAEHQNAFLPL